MENSFFPAGREIQEIVWYASGGALGTGQKQCFPRFIKTVLSEKMWSWVPELLGYRASYSRAGCRVGSPVCAIRAAASSFPAFCACPVYGLASIESLILKHCNHFKQYRLKACLCRERPCNICSPRGEMNSYNGKNKSCSLIHLYAYR